MSAEGSGSLAWGRASVQLACRGVKVSMAKDESSQPEWQQLFPGQHPTRGFVVSFPSTSTKPSHSE